MVIVWHIVLIGWIPYIFYLFQSRPGRKAAIFAIIAGFFFLPQGGYDVPLFPNLDRVTLTSVGVLLAAFTYDPVSISRFRMRWFDLPVLLFVLSPFLSSVTNGLGAYDGATSVFRQAAWWGIPYFLGRVYLNDAEGLWEFAVAFLIGIAIYIPLALFEIRMSPVLHKWIYGRWTRGRGQKGGRGLFGMGRTFILFMDIGINSTMIMAMGGIMLLWVRFTGAMRKLHGVSTALLGAVAVGLAGYSGIFSPVATLVFGFACLLPIKALKSRASLLLLALVIPLYAGARVSGWDAEGLISFTGKVTDTYTLEARIRNATYVIENTGNRSLLGWGPWASRFRTEQVDSIDGFWVNIYGSFGVVGLIGFYGTMILPVVMFLTKAPRTGLRHYGEVAGLALCFAVTAYMVHELFNALLAMPMVVAAGGLAGAWAGFRPPRPQYYHMDPRAQPWRGPAALPRAIHHLDRGL